MYYLCVFLFYELFMLIVFVYYQHTLFVVFFPLVTFTRLVSYYIYIFINSRFCVHHHGIFLPIIIYCCFFFIFRIYCFACIHKIICRTTDGRCGNLFILLIKINMFIHRNITICNLPSNKINFKQ